MVCAQVRKAAHRSAAAKIYQTMRLLPFLFGLFALTPLARGESAMKTIIFFGDSLTAGYGLDEPTLAFPALVQKQIDAAKLPYRVVNAGLSGETTAGGVRRVDWILRQPVDIFVLELGGNDGLRGLTPSQAEENLQTIIDRVRQKNPKAKIVLAGMMMPPNLGEDYVKRFAAIYPSLAEKNRVDFIPFILEGVGGNPALNQADSIHPNAKGHAIIAEHVWKEIRPLLDPS
jgi:acyl-CoA thioesterase I